jgi:hypothetical protein
MLALVDITSGPMADAAATGAELFPELHNEYGDRLWAVPPLGGPFVDIADYRDANQSGMTLGCFTN